MLVDARTSSAWVGGRARKIWRTTGMALSADYKCRIVQPANGHL